MNVYIAKHITEDNEIIGVFKTRRKAEKYIKDEIVGFFSESFEQAMEEIEIEKIKVFN
jgi:hypothetical protein